MSRIPISSLASGVIFDVQADAFGTPLLIPAAALPSQVYQHDTTTPATVYVGEFGPTHATFPLVTDSTGAVPGFIDPNDLPLDIAVTLGSGPRTFVLGPSPGGIVGGVIDGGASA